ncbi:hypothetical protein [Methanoregula sp.]|uniref:hypothetical protein n=1 Tax=Methanoregula sp. TaxID=2052170 RepID=UPI002CDA321A|nr:hypothetical protein [Methanoregula sp.]HVP96865.1 hypothetical protein [Methanoregula sp.]
MKIQWGILGCLLILLLVSAVSADSSSASTSSTTSSTSSSSSSSSTSVDQAALVYVSNVSLDTGEYFPGDEGTLTVTLTNSGTSAIGLEDPTLISSHISTQSDDWEGMSFVGAGSTLTYTIPFVVKPPCGTYFALFTIATQNGNAIHYPVKIKISSNTLAGAITSKPTSFAPEAEQNVTLTLMNTRSGDINNVVITPEGSGIDANPSVELVPSIDAGSSSDVICGITPHQGTDITFNISYQVGDNTHYTDVDLPIAVGQDKTAAVPVVNDVELTSSGTTDEITGDVTNAGISNAYGVTVTVGSPAVATGTYPEYAIGSIASDDSGSFDVTFTTNDLSAVPLVVSWKDSSGNDYNITKTLNLGTSGAAGSATGSSSTAKTTSSSGSTDSMGGPGDMSGGPGGMGGPGGSSSSSVTSLFSGSKGGGISAFYPVIGAAVILIAGIVLWKKRKWILAKVHKKQ